MNQVSTKKVKEDTPESTAINSWDAFNQAVVRAQGNILMEKNPIIEVTPEFIKAVSGGRDVDSCTYGKPAVRVFKDGMASAILAREDMNTDDYYHYEITQKNNAVKAARK